jgi:four helix bundle protein
VLHGFLDAILVVCHWSLVIGHWSLVIGHWSPGTDYAISGGMIIKSLEDLQVYEQALEAADAISAILGRPGLLRDPEMRGQLATCSARIPAVIGEGFGQGTDRHCAHFQRIARGSCNEMRAHLRVCQGRGHITGDERVSLSNRYVVIGKRLTRWIQELMRADRRDRG